MAGPKSPRLDPGIIRPSRLRARLLPPQLCAASRRPNDAIRRKAEKAGRRQRPASQETGRRRDCARASGRGVPMQRGETRRRAVDPWIDGDSACARFLALLALVFCTPALADEPDAGGATGGGHRDPRPHARYRHPGRRHRDRPADHRDARLQHAGRCAAGGARPARQPVRRSGRPGQRVHPRHQLRRRAGAARRHADQRRRGSDPAPSISAWIRWPTSSASRSSAARWRHCTARARSAA